MPRQERVAEFDQDGTLWVEHPLYTQVTHCLGRVPALVKERPELKGKEPFKAVLSGDREAVAKLSMREIFEIVLETQSGMTVEEFRADVRQTFSQAMYDMAVKQGWIVVSMKKDWRKIFAFET